MLDPTNMYPESFHPVALGRSKDFRHTVKGYSRTRRPTKYLLIDFGLSRQYDPANGPPLDEPLHGGDRTAPEHRDGKTPCNPFPTDVYYLGNLVRQHYVQVRAISPSARYLPNSLPRAAKGSSLWRRLFPTWFKKTLGSAPAWMKSFSVFLRSRKSSAHGSYAPELHRRMRFGYSQRGGLLDIGTEPWATSSQTKQRSPSRVDRPLHTVVYLPYHVICRTLHSLLCAFMHTRCPSCYLVNLPISASYFCDSVFFCCLL